MKKYIVVNDCYCEEYLHELYNYPRPGLEEKKLQKEEVVNFVDEFRNLHGRFLIVMKDGVRYTIKPSNLLPYHQS